LIDEDGEKQWEVEALLDHQCVPLTDGTGTDRRVIPNKFKITSYFVKYKGYDEASWQPVDNLVNCDELLETYKRSKGLHAPKYT